MDKALELIEKLGVPVGTLLLLLGAILFVGWRLLVWLKPWAEKAITAHIDLVTKTAMTVEKLGDSQQQQAGTQERQQDTLEKIAWTQQQQAATQQQQANTQQQQAQLQEKTVEQLRLINSAVADGRELLKEHHQFSVNAVAEIVRRRP